MGNGNLVVSSSPHIRSEETVQRIMLDVIIALLPAAAASVYFFGMGALTIMLTSILAAVAAEAAIQKIRNKPVTINDGSAVITGLCWRQPFPGTAVVDGGGRCLVAMGWQTGCGGWVQSLTPPLWEGLSDCFFSRSYDHLVKPGRWVTPPPAWLVKMEGTKPVTWNF